MVGLVVKLMVLVASGPLGEGEAVFVKAVTVLYMEVEAEAVEMVALLPAVTEGNMVVAEEGVLLEVQLRVVQEELAVNMEAMGAALATVRLPQLREE